MGFNYLQTDDRDDYLSQFSKPQKIKPNGYNLISSNDEILLENVSTTRLKMYCKKQYFPIGKSAKYIWRSVLISKGYKIIPIFNN